MDQDINDVYRQTVKISSLFAAGCEVCANFYLGAIAIQASYDTVCRFLLEDVEQANNRAYVLEQLLSSLNGEATMKNDWIQYNKRTLRTFLHNVSPKIESKIGDKHVENIALLWRFGKNMDGKEIALYDTPITFGLNEAELKRLNKILIDPCTSNHYTDFFKDLAKKWCERANIIHQQTQQVFDDVSKKTTLNSKVKI